jgi:rSAM/selenodomain-associated transferase 2
MSARLSIIIPTLNAADALPATLDSLLPGVAAGVIREVIISDGGSTDATTTLAEDAGCEHLQGPAGRGGQLLRGAQVARGEWLLFLHADTHLPRDWVGAVCCHMTRQEAAVFALSFRSEARMARLVAGWANWRTRALGLPYGDQGVLISRALYDAVGGFEDIPLMEDVAMARALKGQITILPEAVSTDAWRYARRGWIRQGVRNLWLLTCFLAGADPAKLARAYRKP